MEVWGTGKGQLLLVLAWAMVFESGQEEYYKSQTKKL